MKRMIDNKDYNDLKKDVKDINDVVEAHTTDFVVTSVVVDDGAVLGSQVKDVKNDVNYNLPLGSQVEANPTLEGTESALESVKLDGTKYKIGGGKQSYQHLFYAWGTSENPMYCYFSITNDNPNQMTLNDVKQYCATNNILVISNNWGAGNYSLNGVSGNLYNSAWYKIDGVALYNNTSGDLIAFQREAGVLKSLTINSERISDKVIAV